MKINKTRTLSLTLAFLMLALSLPVKAATSDATGLILLPLLEYDGFYNSATKPKPQITYTINNKLANDGTSEVTNGTNNLAVTSGNYTNWTNDKAVTDLGWYTNKNCPGKHDEKLSGTKITGKTKAGQKMPPITPIGSR